MKTVEFKNRYSRLNSKQQQAVDQVYGPCLVLAGPGSGKTELMSVRIANILLKTDALAQNILCLTFTDSAANNLRSRLFQMIGKEAYKININTFHSLGTQIISDYPEYFFDGHEYKAVDEISQIQIIQNILEKLPLSDPLAAFSKEHGWSFLKSILSKIILLKQEGISPKQFTTKIHSLENDLNKINLRFIEFNKIRSDKVKDADIQELIPDDISIFINQDYIQQFITDLESILAIIDAKIRSKLVKEFRIKWSKRVDSKNQIKDIVSMPKLKSLARIFQMYQENIKKLGAFDFADMLFDVQNEINSNTDLRMDLQEKYQFIMVDEFQDTSGLQLEFLLRLINPEQVNVLVVGDDDQCIYKFQGAVDKNFLEFRNKFPDTKIISLDQNYRSKSKIIDFANKIMKTEPSPLILDLGVQKLLFANR